MYIFINKLVWITLKTKRSQHSTIEKWCKCYNRFISYGGHILWGTCSKQKPSRENGLLVIRTSKLLGLFFLFSQGPRCKCGSNVSKRRPSSSFFSAPRHILPKVAIVASRCGMEFGDSTWTPHVPRLPNYQIYKSCHRVFWIVTDTMVVISAPPPKFASCSSRTLTSNLRSFCSSSCAAEDGQ